MKFTPPGQARSGGSVPRNVPRAVIIEKKLAEYIPLNCGHLTSWETQQAYAVFRAPSDSKYFCEKCGSWKIAKPKAKPDLPSENNPLF